MSRPLLSRYAECSECCNPILFVLLNTGKRIPVDPMPNPRGNVAAMRIGHNLHGFVLSATHPDHRAPYVLHMPHHATCPERPGPKAAKPAREPDPSLF